jgi:hypothetical protein
MHLDAQLSMCRVKESESKVVACDFAVVATKHMMAAVLNQDEVCKRLLLYPLPLDPLRTRWFVQVSFSLFVGPALVVHVIALSIRAAVS